MWALRFKVKIICSCGGKLKENKIGGLKNSYPFECEGCKKIYTKEESKEMDFEV